MQMWDEHAFRKISIVIPVFNGAKTIGRLVQHLEDELTAQHNIEVVLVNDGSYKDNSAEVCRKIAGSRQWVRFINLARNFGEHNAVMAGLNYCTGDCAVIIDDDFQNSPADIGKLVQKLEEGYDVVFSQYKKKHHSFFRNLGSRFNNFMATILIKKPYDLYLSSFKAINRFLIDEIIQYTGPYPYIDGLVLRTTNNYATVLVEHRPREEGESNYTIKKLISLWMNMFVNFSIIPLRLASIMGFLFAGFSIIISTVFFIEKLKHPDLQAGWASIIISLFLVSSIQLFAIGMVGEYLGRLFLHNNQSPQFVVRDTLNCPVKRAS